MGARPVLLRLTLGITMAAGLGVCASGPAQAAVTWQACGKAYECARLPVPVDWSKPNGRGIGLALVRVPASDPSRRIGSLVVNPGGPGVSGIEWLRRNSERFSPELRERFDLVSFDPRGVGRSSPVLCRTKAERDREMTLPALPRTAAEHAAVVADARRFAEGCARRSGGLLPHLTTEAIARDLERLRSALGDARLSYIGFSWGTVLGATYASLFPKRVRALALDGAADPRVWTGDVTEFLTAQAVSSQHVYAAFLAWCRTNRGDCEFAEDGADPAVEIEGMLARLHDHPVMVRTEGFRRLLTERQAVTAIVATLYSSRVWPLLGSVGDDLEGSDGRLLLLLADSYTERKWDGTYSNLLDAYIAISCVDHAPIARDPAAFTALAARFTRTSPVLGSLLGYEQLPCAFWPVEAASRYTGPFHARGAPPIVVVGTTNDAATPYRWAKSLATQLDSGVLLTRTGDAHTAYMVSACVRGHVDRYLLELTPPRSGTICRT